MYLFIYLIYLFISFFILFHNKDTWLKIKMGTIQSKFDSDAKIYCENHQKEALALCITHKKSICLSCLVQKDHTDADCNLQEMEFVDREIKDCLIIKQLLAKYNPDLDADEIKRKMKIEIEAAYTEALAKLEEYRSLSYKVTTKEVANLIKDNTRCYARALHELDTAIDKYISCNRIEGRNMMNDIKNKSFTTGITFQKNTPYFDVGGNSLVSAREEVNASDRYMKKLTCDDSNDPNDVVDGKRSEDMTT
jgi:hypothetical protein